MTGTRTASAPDSVALAGPRPTRRATEWRVARAVWRVEARRLLLVAVVPAALGVAMSMGSGGDLVDLRAASINAAFNVLLLAAVTLVASHRAVTRGRRDGAEELFDATPAPARARTVGHLLAIVAPVALAVAATVASAVALASGAATTGELVLAELAVGPVLVAGAGCLGVLLARMWPQPFTPYVACVAIAVAEFAANTPGLAGSGARWLVFWVEGSLWWLLPRHGGAHLVYLLGLVAMAAVGALLRHGRSRRLTGAGAAAVALTVVAAGLQMRQPEDHWRRADAKFADPASVQRCWTDKGVRYCAFRGFEEVVEHVAGMVERVRAVTPAPAWPSGLALTQRVTALDLQYARGLDLPHVPAMPRGAVRQPDDGQIHPAVEFGWSPVQEVGLGVQVAAKALRLPIVPEPGTGRVCLAAGQARTVVALWLGGHATADARAGLAWLLGEVEDGLAAQPGDGAVFPVAEVDVYGGFAVSPADVRLALELLGNDDAEVERRIAEHWELIRSPSTTTAQLATLLGARSPATAAPARPFVAHMDADLVELGAPCR